jgi:hypothetical protein
MLPPAVSAIARSRQQECLTDRFSASPRRSYLFQASSRAASYVAQQGRSAVGYAELERELFEAGCYSSPKVRLRIGPDVAADDGGVTGIRAVVQNDRQVIAQDSVDRDEDGEFLEAARGTGSARLAERRRCAGPPAWSQRVGRSR